MDAPGEKPFTIEELCELSRLEREARGETADDATRALRARLDLLRKRKADGWRDPPAGEMKD